MTKIASSSMFRAISRPDPQNLRLLRKAASRYAASISGDGCVVRIRPRTIRFVRTNVCYVVVQGPDGVDIPYKSADGYSWNTTHLWFENTGAYAQDHKMVLDKVLEVAKEFHRRQNHTQDQTIAGRCNAQRPKRHGDSYAGSHGQRRPTRAILSGRTSGMIRMRGVSDHSTPG